MIVWRLLVGYVLPFGLSAETVYLWDLTAKLHELSGMDEVSVLLPNFLGNRLGGPRKPMGYCRAWVITVVCYDVRDCRGLIYPILPYQDGQCSLARFH